MKIRVFLVKINIFVAYFYSFSHFTVKVHQSMYKLAVLNLDPH